MSDTIVLILPTIPGYRLDFLNLLNKKLKSRDKKLVLLTGSNVRNKELKEIESGLSFKVIKTKTIGIRISGVNLYWQKSLIKNVLSLKPEKVVLMLHTGKVNYLILLILLKILKTPFIIWGSGYRRIDLEEKVLKFKHRIKGLFEKLSSGYITYGNHYANRLVSNGYAEEKIIVAQNTINVEAIYSNNKLKKVSKSTHRHFLFVGALIPEKKLNKAIVACSQLRKRGYNFRFDIVGGGNILGELEELVAKLELEDFINCHGPKYGDEIKYIFNKSDVFVLPGTGGLAINEAMAYSLPIISTPGDGTVYDLVENKKNGFLLEYDFEIEELVDKMEFFIKLDAKSLTEMGQYSLKKIKKASLENMVNKFVKGVLSF